MRVLVVGATGGSGRAAVTELGRRGHEVTALSRHAAALTGPGVHGVDGDATDPDTVDALVAGQDAVVVTLGISENELRVRLRGPAHTPMDVRSRGTRLVIAAMRRHGVRRLVVQTSYGVGETRPLLPILSRLVFALFIAQQMADSEVQADALRTSGVDWTEVQPVYLTDAEDDREPFASTTGEIRSKRVSRRQVATYLADTVEGRSHVGETVSLSCDPHVGADHRHAHPPTARTPLS